MHALRAPGRSPIHRDAPLHRQPRPCTQDQEDVKEGEEGQEEGQEGHQESQEEGKEIEEGSQESP